MADPTHLFADEDQVHLGSNLAVNKERIREFRPKNGKLALCFDKDFIEEQLVKLSSSLSSLLARNEIVITW